MIYSVPEIQSRVLPIAQKYNIPALYLFGSYARGEANENSDVDLLVDTTGTALTSLLRLGELYCDLETALKKSIDLVAIRSIMQKHAMPSKDAFRDTVLKEAVFLCAGTENNAIVAVPNITTLNAMDAVENDEDIYGPFNSVSDLMGVLNS